MKRREKLFKPRLGRLILAQDNLCAGCGKPMLKAGERKRTHSDMPTEDHVIPKSLSGVDRIGNMVAMHWACNNAKGDDQPTGCELIWLLAVNNRLGVEPSKW